MNTHNNIQIVTKKTIKLQKLGKKKKNNGNNLKVSRYILPEAVVVLLMGV